VKITSGIFGTSIGAAAAQRLLSPAPQAGADEARAGTLDVAGLCT
jgi:hypothetical protein